VTSPLGKRALIALFRNYPTTQPSERHGWRSMRTAIERRDGLLRWAATMPDSDLLAMRNFGHQSLAWTRAAAAELPAGGYPSAVEGLDVELLTRALFNICAACEPGEASNHHRRHAEAIAREYARLAETTL
jgi:hypothetical protein